MFQNVPLIFVLNFPKFMFFNLASHPDTHLRYIHVVEVLVLGSGKADSLKVEVGEDQGEYEVVVDDVKLAQ